MLKTKSAVDTFTDELTPRRSFTGNVHTNTRRNGEKAAEAKQLFEQLKEVVEPLGVKMTQPQWNGDAREFSEAVIEQLIGDKIGGRAYEGDKVRLHCFETTKSQGLLQNVWTRERKEHLLANPRFHKLEYYEGDMPRQARKIVAKIRKSPALLKGSSILTGILVGEAHSKTAEWNEDTWFKTAGQQLIRKVKGAGDAAAAATGNVVRVVGTQGRAVMDAFENDPAIVIGNLCIFAFKE